MKPDGTGLIQLTDSGCQLATPHWAPDDKIYFSAFCKDNWDLRRMDPPPGKH